MKNVPSGIHLFISDDHYSNNLPLNHSYTCLQRGSILKEMVGEGERDRETERERERERDEGVQTHMRSGR